MDDFWEKMNQAFNQVSVVQLLHRLGYPDAREGSGQKSLFRPDRRAGSVEIKRDYYRDYACDEHQGGHLWVIMQAANCDKSKAIDILFEEAGITRPKQSAGEMKRVAKEKRELAFRAAQNKVKDLPPLKVPEPGPMPDRIRRAWNDGQAAIIEHMDALAESRGWPVEVMRSLVGANKTSFARLPWSNGKDNKRGWAFLVEKPVFRGNECGLVPVGYHVRYERYENKVLASRPYVYVPSIPDDKKPSLSDFQQYLLKLNTKLPAYPFVLGNLDAPKLLIITEGQYDAVSISLAFGWIGGPSADGSSSAQVKIPDGIVIMGLRGVQSCDPLLAAYGGWLRRNKPFVWVIGDNDEAGRNLATRKNFDRIDSEPSFIDRLRAQGCTVAGRFYDIAGCKDFNDIWRAHRPSLEQMQAMAVEAGCGDLLKGE